MIYYFSFLNTNAFKKNPIKILIRAITLSLLILLKKKKIIKYNFGNKNIKFLFLPLKKFMGGHCTGIYAAETIADIIGITRENLSHTAIGSVLTKDLTIIRSSVE